MSRSFLTLCLKAVLLAIILTPIAIMAYEEVQMEKVLR